MTEKELKRINELKTLISRYDLLYYEQGISEISDAEYDRLYDEYLEFEKKYPDIAAKDDAPTKRIGAGIQAGSATSLPKFIHKSPLLSIDRKAKELSDLKDFYDKIGGNGTEVIIQPKLDGITCNINYEHGVLVNAATRGNGYVGDLITENFKNTDTLFPSSIDSSSSIEIRGEAIIPYDFFKLHLMNSYSNPRNAVAGIMRQINPDDVKGKGIHVMFYDFGMTENVMLEDSDDNNVDFIKLLGFDSVPTLKADNWDKLSSIVESKMNGMIQNIDGFNVLVAPDDAKHGLKYPQAVCDGLVIKANSRRKREDIGMSEKGPKWAFAFKFKPLQAETRIDHIEWQVGKTGVLTPVAVFDEISLGGTKISRATLNNFDYMKNLPVLDESAKNNEVSNLRMDDLIIVERSNDVIPRISAIKKHQSIAYQTDLETSMRVGKRMDTFNKPTKCPDCGHDLEDRYPLQYCTNISCPSQMKGRIEHFSSRDAMNIVGLGEGIIDTLFEEKLISSISSIFSLKSKKDQLEKLPKFGKKKVEKLLKSIEDSKNPGLSQFIYSLSIPGVGKKIAKDLAARYGRVEKMLDATMDELIQIEDMGTITASGIVETLKTNEFRKMIAELLDAGISPLSEEKGSNALKGLSFVITGTLSHPRSYYEEKIEKNGGKVSSSVSKKTNVVLIGMDAGSKETKARELVSKGCSIELLDTEKMIEEYLKKKGI